MYKKLGKSILTLVLLVMSGVALADDNYLANQSQPITYLIKFVVSGYPAMDDSGNPIPGQFVVNGKGYAPIVTNTGYVLNNVIPVLQVAKLEGARIQMEGQMSAPVVDFTCIPLSCKITLKDGTVLQSYTDPTTGAPEVPLQGRMAMLFGTTPTASLETHVPVRIFGCGGLQGIAGPKKGWVGSICFNGEFNIEHLLDPGLPISSSSAPLTGGSDCTITLHQPTPLPGQ